MQAATPLLTVAAMVTAARPAGSLRARREAVAVRGARRGARPDVIDALHQAHPSAASALAESGDTPLMLARKHAQNAATTDALEAIARGFRDLKCVRIKSTS